jgi:hypothetical protein
MELHRFFRYAIEKMCKEKKSLNHFAFKVWFYTLISCRKVNGYAPEYVRVTVIVIFH